MDDEPMALNKMADYIAKTPFLELAGTCKSGFEAINLISKLKVDLMFVDINMPDINGLDFVKTLLDKPQIIFTTAFSEYAFEGFKVNAIDYLLKPIGYNEFLKAANKARNYFESISAVKEMENSNRKDLFVKSGYKIVRTSLEDILYIEGMREYVRIHLIDGRSIISLLSLHALDEQLPSDKFMRVHRSYIVNLQKITTIEHNRIIFNEKVKIPVSDQYRDFFQKFLNSNSLG